jgi:hypothetical protein
MSGRLGCMIHLLMIRLLTMRLLTMRLGAGAAF